MSERLPEAVQEYLRGALLETLNPLCVEADEYWRILRRWGDSAAYGLAPLKGGEDALERLPVLVGSGEGSDPLALKFVEIADGCIAHVHIVPHGVVRYVLLLDAGAEHEHLQGVQQTFHDAKLRSFYDRRLLERLKRAQAELEEKKREAESASALKSQFIASMSHEFRTPLTSVIGYADLCAGEQPLAPGQQMRCALAVRRNARYLLHLVDNILDEARLAADMLELHPGPLMLDELAATLRDMFEPLAAERGLDFELSQGARDADAARCVNVDGVRLQQVLVNLIANAIKFTGDGKVTVAIDCSGDVLHARVSDTGPGIDRGEQQRIFAPFQRVGARAHGGAGLGLSITRRLLELMGGSLALDSAPGAGTRWTLSLPVEAIAAPPASGAGQDLTAPDPADLRGTLMLVEDNPDISDLVRLYLTGSAVELICHARAAAALDGLRTVTPDLMLIDLSLPDMDGTVLVERLRQAGCACPVIAFSAAIAEPVLERARRAGMAAFLAKPVSRPALLAMLQRHLNASERPVPGAALAAAERSGARRALFARYRESLPQKRQRIALLGARHGADAGARVALRDALHQLAGSADSYGFAEIGTAAAEALALARSPAAPRASIDTAVDALLDAFDAAIGKPGAFDNAASGTRD